MQNWKTITNHENYEVSDLGNVRNKKRNTILKPSKTKNGYLIVKIGYPQKNIYIHKLVAQEFLGYIQNSRNIVIDHKDNDRTNNSLDNLQIVPNLINTSKDKKNKTGFVGVRASYNKFQARITKNGKRISLGNFDTPEEAYNAYKKECDKLCQEISTS